MNQCFSPDCKTPPAYSFTWGWGSPGHCCEEHKVNAQQVHDAQGRGPIAFNALDPNAAVAPLLRDERTQLIAAKLSAEQDGDLVRARAAELHNANTDLQAEVRRLRARDGETTQQLVERAADLERAIVERDEALADLHEARTELERVALLVPRDAPPPTPRDRHVVG